MPKTFKGYTPNEAVTFTLESPDGTRTATFQCKANVPGSRFLDYMGRAESQEDWSATAKAVREIIDEALTEESSVEFWAFADVPENGVGLEMLAEISGWLAESFSGSRPTAPQPA